MGSLLDFIEKVWEIKKNPSRKAYNSEEVMEKNKDKGVKWKDFIQYP